MAVLGYGLFGLLLGGVGYLLVTATELWRLYVILPLFILPWAMVKTGTYVRRIELTPDGVRFRVVRGVRGVRTVRYGWRSRLTIAGRIQSALELARGQRVPHYTITVERPIMRFVTRSRQQFKACCDERTGAWIVERLRARATGPRG